LLDLKQWREWPQGIKLEAYDDCVSTELSPEQKGHLVCRLWKQVRCAFRNVPSYETNIWNGLCKAHRELINIMQEPYLIVELNTIDYATRKMLRVFTEGYSEAMPASPLPDYIDKEIRYRRIMMESTCRSLCDLDTMDLIRLEDYFRVRKAVKTLMRLEEEGLSEPYTPEKIEHLVKFSRHLGTMEFRMVFDLASLNCF
jgi:hypothetical protein